MRLSLDYPQIWFLGFAGLTVAAGLGAGATATKLVVGAGLLLVLPGIALMLATALTMRRARTTVDPYGQPTALLTSGIFGLSRNPMYLGNAMILGGLCLVFGVPLLALLIVPAFVLTINRRFIPREEDRLRSEFPQQFAQYSTRTRRWI